MDNRAYNNEQPHEQSKDCFVVDGAVNNAIAAVHCLSSKSAMLTGIRDNESLVKGFFTFS